MFNQNKINKEGRKEGRKEETLGTVSLVLETPFDVHFSDDEGC